MRGRNAKKIKGNVVSDLGVARNFREGGSGYTDLNVILTKDDHDSFLEKILSGDEFSALKPDGTMINLIQTIFAVRLTNDQIDDEILLPPLSITVESGRSRISLQLRFNLLGGPPRRLAHTGGAGGVAAGSFI